MQRPSSLEDIVKYAEKSLTDGLYKDAEDYFTNAIKILSNEPSLYEGRSSARIQLHQYEESLHDAEMSLELDPEYVMGYFRQGVALQCLGDFSQSIVSFTEGIVRDQKNPQLLNAIIEVTLNSPLNSSIEPVMSQLRKMQLDSNPFIITSVIGQELLSHNHTEDAVQVLENAVSIGTRSLKLKGSVFSALSSALWSLGDTERAIYYMNEDLTVSRMLSDNIGECRAHGNLGAAYYSQQNYQLAKENHNRQLALAQTIKDEKAMASAFSSLGHVYTAIGDHKSAAESHKQSAAILRKTKDPTGWCKQLELVATSFLLQGDSDSALQWQLECLRVTTDEFETQEGKKEEAKARVNLASIYHKLQRYTEEISCLEKSVEISHDLSDSETEAQTLSSLGYIARHTGDLLKAQSSYERLLELALSSSNHSMEAKACANLGVIHHQIGDFEMALKLQARNLELSLEFRDIGSQGRAHGNIGNAYSAMGMYEQAIQHHLKELEISSATSDKASECTTHGNLAVAYQALKNDEKALHHYSAQLSVSSEIGDITNETRACMNLANYHSSRKEFKTAIEVYKKYLVISENSGIEKQSGISKACYNIGFAYFSLRDYLNAINFYEQSLKISLDTADTVSAARVYCNLGLAWKSYGDSIKAFECQNLFLAISNQLQSTRGVFKALGNMGDIHISIKQPEKAVTFYQQQYTISNQSEDNSLKAQACAALGSAHRIMGNFQKALEYHSEELRLHQELKDSKSEFRAHGHLGAVLTSLGEFTSASKCYENQCYIAKQIDDSTLQSTALGNMGITSINMQDYDIAIDFFERQLLVVENLPKSNSEKGRVICNIADCYEALENYSEAITLFEEALECVVDSKQPFLIERVYGGLSSAHKLTNNIKESFIYSKLRIKICKEMNNRLLLAEAYGEMGYLFTISANFQKALSCLKIQMEYAGDNSQLRGDASCGLGSVHKILRNFQKAVDFHQIDLQIAIETNNVPCQGRAYGNLGAAYEALHDHSMAVKHQEQHLFIADSLNDSLAKLTALRGVARNVLRLGNNHQRACLLLQQALLLARELAMKEDEGKILLDLAISNYISGDLSNIEEQLHEALDILMQEFWKSGVLDDTVNVAVHPNQCIDLYEEILTCQSSLTCLYVQTHQHEKAIQSAEKMRQFPEFVMKRRQKIGINSFEITENVAEKLIEYSTQNDDVVVYYSITAGSILTWVITPDEGLCGFTQSPILIDSKKMNRNLSSHDHENRPNLLSHLLLKLRDSLGLETPSVEPEDPPSVENDQQDSVSIFVKDSIDINEDFRFESCANEKFQLYHRLLTTQAEMYFTKNSSTLLGNEEAIISTKLPIFALYELLIGGIKDKIQKYASKHPMKKLVFVLEGELLLAPFSLLKKRSTESYLSQQFNLQVVMSANELLTKQRSTVTGQCTRGIVVGNPVTCDITGIVQSRASDDEANLVASFLKVEPMIGNNAAKSGVLRELENSECLHLACSVSTAPPYGIYLSSSDDKESKNRLLSSDNSNTDSGIGKEVHLATHEELFDLEQSEVALSPEQLETRVLTPSDIMNLDLSRLKLVVFGSAHLQGVNLESKSANFQETKLVEIFALARSFYAAGAKTLLLPLWPVPETVCKILTQSFYSQMMAGVSASKALSQSIQILRNSEQFEHSSYWAGFVLIGQDITLDSQNLSLFHALWLLIKSGEGRFHDVIRLLLHLIDKSLERMDLNTDTTVPMYASQASISKKVQDAQGWREIFSAVGFELRSGGSGIPDAVFFPKADKRQEILTIKSELISYLQFTNPVITGINRLFSQPSFGCKLKEALRSCIEEQNGGGSLESEEAERMTLIIQQKTWRAGGCSELLTGLGFSVSQIGEESVMLHCTPSGHSKIKTTLELMDAFFDFSDETSILSGPSKDLKTESKIEKQRMIELDQQKPGALSNVITRGLPPSTRRSIAVDFGSSFKSQSSLDMVHLELPDHMTKPFRHDTGRYVNQTMNSVTCEENQVDHGSSNVNAAGELKIQQTPKDFTNVPSSGGIIVPTPILPQTSHLPNFKFASPAHSPDPLGKRSHSLRNIADDSDVTKPIDDAIMKNTQQSHTLQRSKRFQFHGSQQTLRNTLEIKVPRSPQKSPMFYRKDDHTNTDNASPVVHDNFPKNHIKTENLDTPSPKLEIEHRTLEKQDSSAHFVPIIFSETVAQNQPEKEESMAHFVPIISSETKSSPVANFVVPSNIVYPKPKRLGSKWNGENTKYIPAPSVARSLPVHTQPFDYSHIVDKLTRLSTSDLSDGGHSDTDQLLFEDTNNNAHSKEAGHRASHPNFAKNDSDIQNFESSFSNAKVHTSMHPNRSPQGGAGMIVGRKNQLQISKIDDLQTESLHTHSRSLDSAVNSLKQESHKHTLSQDGAPPPPYKHPDFMSPRRSSGDIVHSRTNSYASHSSNGSQKASPKKLVPKTEKRHQKKQLTRTISDQSFTGSEGSHVSYQLETGNHGKTWSIHENAYPQVPTNQEILGTETTQYDKSSQEPGNTNQHSLSMQSTSTQNTNQRILGTGPVQYRYNIPRHYSDKSWQEPGINNQHLSPHQSTLHPGTNQGILGTGPTHYQYNIQRHYSGKPSQEPFIVNQPSSAMQSTLNQHQQCMNQALQSWYEPTRTNAVPVSYEQGQNQPIYTNVPTADVGQPINYNIKTKKIWSSGSHQTSPPLYQPQMAQFMNQAAKQKPATNSNFQYKNMQFKPVKPPKPSHLTDLVPNPDGAQPTNSKPSDKLEEEQIAFV